MEKKNIKDLDISVRTRNRLIKCGVNTVKELLSYSLQDLMRFRDFGRSGLNELKNFAKENNLEFKPNPNESN